MGVYAYIRVSKLTAKSKRGGKEQASDHNSREAQEAKLRGEAAAAGLEFTPVMIDGVLHDPFFIDEDVSSRTGMDMRPEGGKLYRILKPGDHLFIAKLDRAFRNTREFLNTLERWIPSTIPWKELTSDKMVTLHISGRGAVDPKNPFTWAMIQMQAVFDELERNKISESTSDALRAKAARGERTGGCEAGPGYRWQSKPDGTTVRVKDPDNEKMWAELMDWHFHGGFSFSQIASHLNKNGAYKEIQVLARDKHGNVLVPRQWAWKRRPWTWRMVKFGLQQAMKNGIVPKSGWPEGHKK